MIDDLKSYPQMKDSGVEWLGEAPEHWVVRRLKTGYEISFTRYFYKPKPMRTLAETRSDILVLEKETGGFLDDILKVSGSIQ